jgi:hypothetical protein
MCKQRRDGKHCFLLCSLVSLVQMQHLLSIRVTRAALSYSTLALLQLRTFVLRVCTTLTFVCTNTRAQQRPQVLDECDHQLLASRTPTGWILWAQRLHVGVL